MGCTARRWLPPPSRTKWTRRVPHPVLIGHAASLTRWPRLGTSCAGLALLCSVPPSGTSGTVGRYLLRKPGLACGDRARPRALSSARRTRPSAGASSSRPTARRATPTLRATWPTSGATLRWALDLSSALKQFPGRTAAGADGRADWLPRAPPVLVLGAEGDVVVDLPAVQETAAFYGVR